LRARPGFSTRSISNTDLFRKVAAGFRPNPFCKIDILKITSFYGADFSWSIWLVTDPPSTKDASAH